MKRSAVMFMCLLMLATLAAATPADASLYISPTRVVPGDFYSDPFIDEQGNIVTSSYTEDSCVPSIIRPDGTMRLLQAPASDWVYIISLASSGLMIGGSGSDMLKWDAAGNFATIDFGIEAENEGYSACAINNRGYMAGEHYHARDQYQYEVFGGVPVFTGSTYTSSAWVRRPNGSEMPLQSSSRFACNAPRDMNDAGWVVGAATSKEMFPIHYQAVLWSPDGTIKELKTDQGNSVATAISNSGEIAGSTDSGPVVWNTRGKVNRKLQRPDWATDCCVTDINDKGIAVGYVGTGDDAYFMITCGALWDQRGRLSYLQPLENEMCSSACHINNSGQVVGWSGQANSMYSPPVPQAIVVWTVK